MNTPGKLNIPLRPKNTVTTTATPADGAPVAPRMPSQGHTQQDDQFNIPPPPAMPDGEYLCRVKNVYLPINKDTGKWETWDNGDPKQTKVFFLVDDPAEQRKQMAGKENCYGIDLEISIDWGSNWYNRSIGYLTALGAPRIGWPKDGAGKTSAVMLAEHIMAVTKGKKFLVEARPVAGKGDKKAQLYKNVKKISAPPVVKAAPKPAAAAPTPEPDPDEAAEESATGTNPDAPPADTTEEE